VDAGPRVAAVVTAGGRSRRYVADKIAELLDDVLAGLPPLVGPVVCVGPPRPVGVRRTLRPELVAAVRWVREEPAYGGPLAAVAAGLAAVGDDAGCLVGRAVDRAVDRGVDRGVEIVVVVGGDMPRVGLAVPALVAAALAGESAPAVLASDGRPQPLASAWRPQVLGAALAAVGPPAGRPLRDLLDQVRPVLVPDAWGAGADVDEPADLERVRDHRDGPAAEGPS
jgi:molybdopterin-guanine dinucleotide biosynthesis protein A